MANSCNWIRNNRVEGYTQFRCPNRIRLYLQAFGINGDLSVFNLPNDQLSTLCIAPMPILKLWAGVRICPLLQSRTLSGRIGIQILPYLQKVRWKNPKVAQPPPIFEICDLVRQNTTSFYVVWLQPILYVEVVNDTFWNVCTISEEGE